MSVNTPSSSSQKVRMVRSEEDFTGKTIYGSKSLVFDSKVAAQGVLNPNFKGVDLYTVEPTGKEEGGDIELQVISKI